MGDAQLPGGGGRSAEPQPSGHTDQDGDGHRFPSLRSKTTTTTSSSSSSSSAQLHGDTFELIATPTSASAAARPCHSFLSTGPSDSSHTHSHRSRRRDRAATSPPLVLLSPDCPASNEEWANFMESYQTTGTWRRRSTTSPSPCQPCPSPSPSQPASSSLLSPPSRASPHRQASAPSLDRLTPDTELLSLAIPPSTPFSVTDARLSSNRRSLSHEILPQTSRMGSSKVKCELSGKMIDQNEFFARFGYLPAPLPPTRIRRLRRTALRRYGLVKPGVRQCLDRYVKHARRVFRTESARISTPCPEDDSILLCVSESDEVLDVIRTGPPDPAAKKSCLLYSWSKTICSHAMLLNTEQVLVVPDVQKDWRFASNPEFKGKEGKSLRFYASAPLLVSMPEIEGSVKVEIGRLAILGSQPRPDFDEADAQLLGEIAAMACEALEAEYQNSLAHRSTVMQSGIARIADYMWKTPYPALHETNYTTAPHKDICEISSKVVSEVMPASATIVDVTGFRISSLRTEAGSPVGSSGPLGRRVSLAKGGRAPTPGSLTYSNSIRSPSSFYPQAPWLDATSPRSGYPFNRSADAGTNLSNHSVDTPSVASSSSSSAMWTTPTSAKSSPTHSRSGSSTRFTRSSLDLGEEEYVAEIDPAHTLEIFAHSGKLPPPDVSTGEARTAIADFLVQSRKNLLQGGRPWAMALQGPYLTASKIASSSDTTPSEGDDTFEGGQARLTAFKSPLAALFNQSDQAAMYLILPISQDTSTPQITFLLILSFSDILPIDEPEVAFLRHVGRLIAGSLVRQKGHLAEQKQLEFVRSLQHELFTPLYGVLGASELLLSSLSGGGKELDTSPDGLLAKVLEGIRLSAGNLSSILDDVLDFGELSGVRSAKSLSRLDVVTLATLVEEVGQEEVEVAAIGLRHANGLTEQAIAVRPPDFIITVDPSLSGRFKVDRLAMRKIFRKLLHNCFRFTKRTREKAGLVEVIVRPVTPEEASMFTINHEEEVLVAFEFIDSGCGMTQDFLRDEYLSPFVKGDSFQQGTGLGGAIAAGLSARLGGYLDVCSTPGEGTSVKVTLPLLRCQTSSKPSSEGDASLTSFADGLRECKVSRAFFMPFEGAAANKKTGALIQKHLVKRGIEIVEDPSVGGIDLLVVPERTLVCPEGYCRTCLPTLPGSRVVVVCPDPTQRSTRFPILKSLPFHLFKSPFCSSSLALLDDFLQESHPIALRSPPSSSHRAIDFPDPPTVEEKEAADLTISSPISESPISENSTPPAPTPTLQPRNKYRASTRSQTLSARAGKTLMPAPRPDGFKVLAVEDNPTNLRILTVVLERAGIEYYKAVDGREAVEQFKKHRPHLVLLDISLPIMDGFECCKLMRDIEATSFKHRPRIFAVTALSSKEDQSRGRELGMDAWYHKPISPRTLAHLLKDCQSEWETERGSGDVGDPR